MKKLLLLMLLVSCAFTAAIAQPVNSQQSPPPPPQKGPHKPGQQTRDNVEALKVAFVTRQLNLTAEEAQKFWPVHNSYMEELKKARKENTDNEIAFEEKALAIRKKYNTDFKKILNSDERANQLFRSEKDFNNMMRKELMDRKKNKNPKPNKGMGHNPPENN